MSEVAPKAIGRWLLDNSAKLLFQMVSIIAYTYKNKEVPESCTELTYLYSLGLILANGLG
jgi:hypothetical protein